MGVCHNITDRKRAEEALQKAHAGLEEKVNARTAELMRANEELAMFRKFAETSGQGFSMADLDGCITYVNPALCRMLGAERPAEVVGKHLSTYFSDESNRKGQLEVRPALKQDGYWQGELAMLSCHGTSIPTWHNTFMIRDEQGVPLRIAVVITDITERKQAEGALQRERRTLEHLLQSSDHERQLIAYEIHDGLAQYLTGAIMHFQMWDELQVQNCAEAAKAFDLGMTLLRQGLGEARRLISGVRPPILDESGIVAALAHLAYDFRTHKGPHVEFRSEVEFGRLAPVLENAIYRIAQEGLTNACKHSKSKNVSVALLQRGDEVRVVICDQGVGFDLATVGEGCFGLEGIRERARLLAGRAVIDSESGKGTRLTVDLPIVLRSENGR
jgi:PAS domain S-box-containing protein